MVLSHQLGFFSFLFPLKSHQATCLSLGLTTWEGELAGCSGLTHRRAPVESNALWSRLKFLIMLNVRDHLFIIHSASQVVTILPQALLDVPVLSSSPQERIRAEVEEGIDYRAAACF
jgi:hypothetical protein